MPHQGALQTIDAQLVSLAAEETRCRDEIRRIQQRREMLIVQRTMIERRKTIYSIPTEVLLHVFHFFVQWDEEDWEDGEEIDWRPMTLSHVCSTWRAAVLNTSSLWACIDFSRYPIVRPMISRSKEQPIDVVHGMKPLRGYKHDIRFEAVLRSTALRWRSLLWESTELRMTDVLSVLNSGTSFPRLCCLELGIEKRTLPGVPLSPLPSIQLGKTSLLPRLERMCLSSISLSELPPTHLPSLRFLTLHFPSKYPSTRANLFRMSSLHSFLSRTPQLESLVFSDSTPLMDVFVRLDAQKTVEDSDQLPLLPSNQIVPLTLPFLRRFEWSHAPPKDLWRFFAMIKMPALKELELYLDAGERRWCTFYATILEPMGDEPFSPKLLHPVVRLDQLEDLAVFATDVDGLCSAFRSMEFPKLAKLTLGHLVQRATKLSKASPPGTAHWVTTPTLPSQETIFREPRMKGLSHLTWSNFRLNRFNASTMLAYMQNLEHLTLESCKDANSVVCALSGSTDCEDSTSSSGRRWPCPRLQHLVLEDCTAIKSGCIKHTILARKRHAEGLLPPTPERPVKPLRRSRMDSPVEGICSGASRSPIRPVSIRSVDMANCPGISVAEIDGSEFGLQELHGSN